MYAGHYQWQAIASAIGRPLSELRTISDGEVYAAFYYIEERIPRADADRILRSRHMVRFSIALRSFKNIAVEGQCASIDRTCLAMRTRFSRSASDTLAHPSIRFGNIFITPVDGNSELRVAPPANADFSAIPPLPNSDNPYHLIGRRRRQAPSVSSGTAGDTLEKSSAFGTRLMSTGTPTVPAWSTLPTTSRSWSEPSGRWSSLDRFRGDRVPSRHRRTAYYGNADPRDTIRVARVGIRGAWTEQPCRPSLYHRAATGRPADLSIGSHQDHRLTPLASDSCRRDLARVSATGDRRRRPGRSSIDSSRRCSVLSSRLVTRTRQRISGSKTLICSALDRCSRTSAIIQPGSAKGAVPRGLGYLWLSSDRSRRNSGALSTARHFCEGVQRRDQRIDAGQLIPDWRRRPSMPSISSMCSVTGDASAPRSPEADSDRGCRSGALSPGRSGPGRSAAFALRQSLALVSRCLPVAGRALRHIDAA